ncbi:hypothetical protein [Inhella gelatinilytica]|uniref:Uncharacterized protein n=1 Tax=Inhella gelatinilytica TaxID=2795030 RepID=A0A931NC81_9BURK|nr:hypothetical protein [Inhella gelatinilytica]MBH9551702.1 hypothetical protein [Inhella gelatinilytica]
MLTLTLLVLAALCGALAWDALRLRGPARLPHSEVMKMRGQDPTALSPQKQQELQAFERQHWIGNPNFVGWGFALFGVLFLLTALVRMTA